MKLLDSRSKETLVPRLQVARTAWECMRGLLGRESLAADEGLWITQRGSIHTFFMKFAIDLVFVDRKLTVTKTVAHVEPGRFVWRGWRSHSVIELQAGFLDRRPIRVGDQLHVDS